MNRRIIGGVAYVALAGILAIHAFLFWNERALIAKGYPDFTIFYSAALMIRQGLGLYMLLWLQLFHLNLLALLLLLWLLGIQQRIMAASYQPQRDGLGDC